MDIFEAFQKRHSYRGPFTDSPVHTDDLKRIVSAGLAAPSGCNAQTTEFVIIDDEAIVGQINRMHESNIAMQQGKAYIACVLDKEPKAVYEGLSFAVEDCAAAVENMLLAITALGYASVWVDGWLRKEGRAADIAKMLSVPDTKTIRIILPIGVPAEQRKQPDKKPLEERAFFNKYK
ncbi:MAG: nitroreductase [Planctomycetes bacterium]|nr:nitroreductase [Planctomycetota bacterium]